MKTVLNRTELKKVIKSHSLLVINSLTYSNAYLLMVIPNYQRGQSCIVDVLCTCKMAAGLCEGCWPLEMQHQNAITVAKQYNLYICNLHLTKTDCQSYPLKTWNENFVNSFSLVWSSNQVFPTRIFNHVHKMDQIDHITFHRILMWFLMLKTVLKGLIMHLSIMKGENYSYKFYLAIITIARHFFFSF